VTPIGGRRLAGNAALNLLGQGLPLLAAIPAIPLLIQGAGVERFGLLTIAWVLIGYVGLFDFGIGRALTHAVAERVGMGREAEVRGVVRVGLRIAAALAFPAGALVVLSAPWLVSGLGLEGGLAAEAVTATRVVGVAVPIVVLAAVLRGVLEGLHRFGAVNAVRIPMGIATFLAPLAVLPWTPHLAALVGAILGARLLGWAGYAWVVRLRLSTSAFQGPPRLPEGAYAGLLRYGGWATVTNLIGPLMVHFDRVAIGAVLTAAVVAFYTTPFEIVHRLLLIPGSVVAVFFPAFAQSWASEAGDGQKLFRGSVQAILLLVVPPALILFAFAGEGLALWVGEEFAREGTGVARWLLVGMVLNSVAHVPFVLLQGIGRPDVTARIHLVEVPLYAAALLWVLPRYGILGAAAVWAGRVALDLVLLLAASARLAPELRAEAVRTCVLLAPALGILVLPLALPDPVVRGAVTVAVVLATGAAGWWWVRSILVRSQG